MTVKIWYRSKTIWANILFLLALIAMRFFGIEIGVEEQAAVIIVVNLILRVFTGTGLAKDQETADMLNE